MKKATTILMLFSFGAKCQFNDTSYKVSTKAGTAIQLFVNEVFPNNTIKLTPIILYMTNRGLTTGCGAINYNSFFYCPTDNKVYLSIDKANEIYSQFGDGGLFNVIAHEYGHLIQNQYQNENSDMDLTVLKELRSDCIAGVFFNWSAKKGYLENNDYPNAVNCLAVHSDNSTTITELLSNNAHGRVIDRRAAFEVGFRLGSVERCYYNYSSSVISQK